MVREKTILFVCTGNTCRSSMAEALAKRFAEKRLTEPIRVRILSAGTGALDGEPASNHAKNVMSELGIDLSVHQTRRLTEDLINKADYIFTMTENQKNHVLRLVPEAKEKVFRLKEFAQGESVALLKAQIQKLNEAINQIKKRFFNEHHAEIEQLEQKRKKLLRELQEVEKELSIWDNKIHLAAEKEVMALQELENELRNLDIIDPFGLPLEYYRHCACELEQAVGKAMEFILKGKIEKN